VSSGGRTAEGPDQDAMIDLEIGLVKAFGWSLREIDETDIETLIPFVRRFGGGEDEPEYIDQVDWL
jgi:hypothetical protein